MFTLKSPVDSFVKTVKGVLLSPVNFFKNVKWESVELTDSAVFALICYLFSSVMSYFIVSSAVVNFLPPTMRSNLMPTGLTYYLTTLVFTLVIFIIGAFIYYAVVKYVFKAKCSFNAVFAAVSAVSSISLFGWIPIIGWILSLYGLVLIVIAIREVAKLTTAQAIISLIITFLVNMVLTGFVFAKFMATNLTNPSLNINQGTTDLQNQLYK